jgi:hypothetical protein
MWWCLGLCVGVQDGVGYKFCLAVQMEKSYKDYHLAFSAATGQVADNHDILEVTTRYLAASDVVSHTSAQHSTQLSMQKQGI